MQRYTVYLYLETALHVLGGIPPIIRSAYNCIYSIWYLSHCSESLMTHMVVAGGYVKQIWLVLGWARGWQVKTIVLC
jgi:hypothetical protein